MEKNAFQGTDHRDSNALDFDDTKTSYTAEEIAISMRYQTYSPRSKPTDHIHILFK
ncbi:MAG: hypothetical protein ACRCV0_00355 [Brevinema sp.]